MSQPPPNPQSAGPNPQSGESTVRNPQSPGRLRAALRRRRPGFAAALVMLLLVLLPQLYLWHLKGAGWSGHYFYSDADEVAYAAYLNALIDGRPRRADPYTGRDSLLEAAGTESLFSIQFVPPYALAAVARAFNLDASSCMMLLLCATAVASTLAVSELLLAATGDARVAAAGALVVLFCAGMLATGYGLYGFHPAGRAFPASLSFRRRYLPAFPFPVFFVFCLLAWRSLAAPDARARLRCAASAGLLLALLVFCYFFLWTAAAAWLAVLAIVWMARRPSERGRVLKSVAVVAAPAAAALAFYAHLLSKRSAAMDEAQFLTLTRAPDLFRVPELLGLLAAAALVWARQSGRVPGGDGAALLAASFALTPVVLFNQQVLTGRSLQPVHYEMLVANYSVLVAAVMLVWLVRRGAARGGGRAFSPRLALAAALAAAGWGAAETAFWARRMTVPFMINDNTAAAAARLAELGRAGGKLDTTSVVLATTPSAADYLPTAAPQAVLWAPHMFVFPGAPPEEVRERMLHYFYLSGVDLSHVGGRAFADYDPQTRMRLRYLAGQARLNPNVNPGWRPVTPAELRSAADEYARFAASFDRERAARHALSYVLVYDYDPAQLSNLDRFYERDAGERVGHFTLYRVRLRP